MLCIGAFVASPTNEGYGTKPEKQHTLLLAQLALTLAHRIPDINQVLVAIDEACEGICLDEKRNYKGN